MALLAEHIAKPAPAAILTHVAVWEKGGMRAAPARLGARPGPRDVLQAKGAPPWQIPAPTAARRRTRTSGRIAEAPRPGPPPNRRAPRAAATPVARKPTRPPAPPTAKQNGPPDNRRAALLRFTFGLTPLRAA